MQNATNLQTFNTNPYLYAQPQPLPAPIVAAQPAYVVGTASPFYSLNAPNLTGQGQGQGDFFTSTGAPVNYTATSTALPAPLPPPFKLATTGTDFNFQKLNLADAFNTNTTNVGAIPPVTNYAPQVMAPNTTMIPGYTPPGGNFNMLA